MLIIGSCLSNGFEYEHDHSVIGFDNPFEKNTSTRRGGGYPPRTTPPPKNYLPPSSNAENKKVLYFANGDRYDKVRGMINKMRSKLKPKFAAKNKKGIRKEYYGPL